MNIDNLGTIDQLRDFLEGTQPVAFNAIASKDKCYSFIQRALVKFSHPRPPRQAWSFASY